MGRTSFHRNSTVVFHWAAWAYQDLQCSITNVRFWRFLELVLFVSAPRRIDADDVFGFSFGSFAEAAFARERGIWVVSFDLAAGLEAFFAAAEASFFCCFVSFSNCAKDFISSCIEVGSSFRNSGSSAAKRTLWAQPALSPKTSRKTLPTCKNEKKSNRQLITAALDRRDS